MRVLLHVPGIWALSFTYPFLRTCRTAALTMSTPNITFVLGFHHGWWKEGGVNFTSACLVKVPRRQCLTRFWFSKVNLQQPVWMQDPFLLQPLPSQEFALPVCQHLHRKLCRMPPSAVEKAGQHHMWQDSALLNSECLALGRQTPGSISAQDYS